MSTDIRDRNRFGHEQIAALNFVRRDPGRVFRRHANQGLRSHVIEVLAKDSVRMEQTGVDRGGVRWFPRARPLRMLRIFRTRFGSRRQAEAEARKLKTMARYLHPSQFAGSEEFLVEYRHGGQRDILLCGLQQYIDGLPLDPWSDTGLHSLVCRLTAVPEPGRPPATNLEGTVKRELTTFADSVRRMVAEAGAIPDLAGNRNLLVTPEGRLVLVDINNVAAVVPGDAITVDDKGYPAVDKSIEALHRIEVNLLGRPAGPGDPLFARYLEPGRRRAVAKIEATFHGRF